MGILYIGTPDRGQQWQALFEASHPELPFYTWPDVDDLGSITYLIAWQLPPGLLERLPALEVVFSVGAGVDQYLATELPDGVALVRMVEPGIVEGVVEYVSWATLTLHRHIIDYLARQRAGHWQAEPVVRAGDRRIGVMGLGRLGQAVLTALASFGFPLAGWSRTRHDLPGVRCYAGREQLDEFLGRCDILICLLPLTETTRGILDSRVFRQLPRGASVINAGRGGHLRTDDLLAALDDGHLEAAILDVTDPEPLPPDHPLWSHERILVTPHIAAETKADSAGEVLVENIRRHRVGEPLLGQVDRKLGY